VTERLDIVFVDSAEESGKIHFALQRADPEGNVIDEWKCVTGDAGLPDIEQILTKRKEKYVVVVWQADRVLRDMKRNPFGNRAIVDLYQLAWVVAAEGEVSSRSIASLCKWCSVDGGKLVTAHERVGAIRECYVRLMHRLAIGLRVEGVGRELMTEFAGKAAAALGRFAK
jgi:hypothetical protein